LVNQVDKVLLPDPSKRRKTRYEALTSLSDFADEVCIFELLSEPEMVFEKSIQDFVEPAFAFLVD